MNKKKLIDLLGWGLALWLIGYLLGILLFMFVPQGSIGWVIMPIGIVITLWVLFKKIKSNIPRYYIQIAIAWTLIAVLFDYLFIVKMLNSPGYYKIDVYIYYLLTFFMPVAVGWYKIKDT